MNAKFNQRIPNEHDTGSRLSGSPIVNIGNCSFSALLCGVELYQLPYIAEETEKP